MEQSIQDHLPMWTNLLADYGLERPDFINEARTLISSLDEKDGIEMIEQTLSANCVAWHYDKNQLEPITELIDEFKKKLKGNAENSSWLQQSYLLKAETLSLDTNIRCTLTKLIYERCLTKYPTDDRLWLDYIAYMEKPKEPKSKDMYHTAICDGYLKCKPMELINRVLQIKPTIAINHKYLELLEKSMLSAEQMESEIKRQLQRLEPHMELNVELQLDYLAYRVRHTDVNNEEEVPINRTTYIFVKYVLNLMLHRSSNCAMPFVRYGIVYLNSTATWQTPASRCCSFGLRWSTQS